MNSGSPSWARTNDPRINSPLLYRLSYRGMQKRNYIHNRKNWQDAIRSFFGSAKRVFPLCRAPEKRIDSLLAEPPLKHGGKGACHVVNVLIV